MPLLEKHAGLGDPLPDTSNRYIGNEAVIAFGKKLYFDPHFSGKIILADMLLRPMTSPGRGAMGAPVNASFGSTSLCR